MDFTDLGQGLDAFARRVEDYVIPDRETQKAMNTEGAKVLADRLREATPRSKHQYEKYGHLQDNVTYQGTDINGEENGNATVGYSKKAYVARFLNDGTIKMAPTHFVDNARREAADEVFAAQKKLYDERMGDKQ